MSKITIEKNAASYGHFVKPKIIKKLSCEKHGEHDVGLHLLKSDEHICMLCVRDLVGIMEVEYE